MGRYHIITCGGIQMKANVAWSTEKDEYLAGRACSKKAVLDLIQTKVAFVFNTCETSFPPIL